MRDQDELYATQDTMNRGPGKPVRAELGFAETVAARRFAGKSARRRLRRSDRAYPPCATSHQKKPLAVPVPAGER